jgi:hypothetical protein
MVKNSSVLLIPQNLWSLSIYLFLVHIYIFTSTHVSKIFLTVLVAEYSMEDFYISFCSCIFH